MAGGGGGGGGQLSVWVATYCFPYQCFECTLDDLHGIILLGIQEKRIEFHADSLSHHNTFCYITYNQPDRGFITLLISDNLPNKS